MPPWIIHDTLKFKRSVDRKNTLCGKLLLRKALVDFAADAELLATIKYNSFRRPFIEKGPFADFNISHSDELVVCILSDTHRVGIDVEKIRNIAIEDFQAQFTARERALLKSADHPLQMFYDLWTKKEAVVKADGRGLTLPLPHIDVSGRIVSVDDLNWSIRKVDIENAYSVHLATNAPCDDYVLTQCNL